MIRLTVLCICLVFVNMLLLGTCEAMLSMEGAVAIWLLDEGKGNEVTDASGNNHSGAFFGEPAWVEGKFGSALSFDGKDDYVEILDPVTGEFVDFTIGCWVKPGDTQKMYANILDTHKEPPRQGITFEQNGNDANSFYFAFGDKTNWDVTDPVQLNSGTWNHLVGVRMGENMTVFINGEISTKTQIPKIPVGIAESNFRIANWVNGGREFNGVIDEAFVFSKALSQDEITSIMKSGIMGALSVSSSGKTLIRGEL